MQHRRQLREHFAAQQPRRVEVEVGFAPVGTVKVELLRDGRREEHAEVEVGVMGEEQVKVKAETQLRHRNGYGLGCRSIHGAGRDGSDDAGNDDGHGASRESEYSL